MERRKKKVDWKEQAEKLFFGEHKKIGEIAAATGISRQAVSAYLKTRPGYMEEKESRKAENAVKRKEYKKQKNREYRALAVTAETLRREHDIAALVLSRERYY